MIDPRAWLGAIEPLAWLGAEGLAHPARSALALAVVLAGLVLAWRRRPTALAWPALEEARAAGARHRGRGRVLALALRAASLLLLGLALGEPYAVARHAPEAAPGLDLVLAVDASGSMRALDASRGGEQRTRFDLAREVVARFAERRVGEGDRVGLVVFGETAFTQTPLTRDGGLLLAGLGRIRPGITGENTALGDALALAARRALGGRDAPGGAGRLVVLLTDGRSNAGAVPTEVAADAARALGVRVHTVGIGSTGEVPVAGGPRGLRFERHDLDERTLARIAAQTGGRYFPARSSSALAAVYAEIDGLERVERPLPASGAERRASRSAPLLRAAGALVLLELLLARVAWRPLP